MFLIYKENFEWCLIKMHNANNILLDDFYALELMFPLHFLVQGSA